MMRVTGRVRVRVRVGERVRVRARVRVRVAVRVWVRVIGYVKDNRRKTKDERQGGFRRPSSVQ
jgi:hypothetical protein